MANAVSKKSIARSRRRVTYEFRGSLTFNEDPGNLFRQGLLRWTPSFGQFRPLAASTIRTVLEKSSGASDAVDVLALARVHARFLLQREEFKVLPRWDAYLRDSPTWINLQRIHAGVTEIQQWTVEHEELGAPMPAGVAPQRIPIFPTPGRIIGKIGDPAKRKMLERLYPEYLRLCSFAHGHAEATFTKQMFDKRSPFRGLLSDEQKRENFDKVVISDAFTISFLCILQSSVELTVLYPNNVDLPEIVIKGWNSLSDASLLGRAIWGIRTRQLFGAVA